MKYIFIECDIFIESNTLIMIHQFSKYFTLFWVPVPSKKERTTLGGITGDINGISYDYVGSQNNGS